MPTNNWQRGSFLAPAGDIHLANFYRGRALEGAACAHSHNGRAASGEWRPSSSGSRLASPHLATNRSRPTCATTQHWKRKTRNSFSKISAHLSCSLLSISPSFPAARRSAACALERAPRELPPPPPPPPPPPDTGGSRRRLLKWRGSQNHLRSRSEALRQSPKPALQYASRPQAGSIC